MACVVAEGFWEEVGFPPLGDVVFFEVWQAAGEACVVFFGLLAAAYDDGSEAVWVGGVETHFCSDPFCSFAAAVCAFPPDVYAECMAAVGAEHCRRIPEGIVVGVVLQDAAVVSPAVADDLGESLAGYADELGCGVGGVVHGGHAVSPCSLALGIAVGLVVEVVQTIVLVFGLAVVNLAETALIVKFAG